MKFSIGYQLPDELDSIPAICRDFQGRVSDVYFSWCGEPSGRSPLCGDNPSERRDVQEVQLAELREIRQTGASLTLLLNANCYGEQAVSRALSEHALSLTEMLQEQVGIANVTTTSPFLAERLKTRFGDTIRVRASVNMRVGNIHTMRQLAPYFDGFYLQKELNRDFDSIRRLSDWCEGHQKTLHLLANSGCMAYCGFQTFHDNLVAHEQGVNGQENIRQEHPALCHRYLRELPKTDAFAAILAANWIRPEELHLYEPYFSEVKLATRMHARPRMVLSAYARGRFTGNLLDLTEPSYSPLFRGTILDSTRLPEDWFAHVSSCSKDCESCGYCRAAAEQAILDLQ